MHHQRIRASSLAVIPQTLSLPPAELEAGFTHTQEKKNFFLVGS